MKLMPVLLVALTIAALSSGCADPGAAASGVQTHTLSSRATGVPRLELDLPTGFHVRRHEGPDFDVFYFRDTKRNASLGVYVGQHPGLHSNESELTDITRVAGHVGNASVEWLHWRESGDYHSEALIKGFYGTPEAAGNTSFGGLLLHVFAQAPTSEQLSALEAAASSLRLK